MHAVPALGNILDQDFVRNAFLGGTFIALAAGLVGYFLVLRNQVFSGDALGHVAFTGALGALAIGVNPLVGLFSATVACALGVETLGGRARGRDVVIGMVFAWTLGLGVLFLSIYTTSGGSTDQTAGISVLFGSIHGLSLRQATVAAGIGAGVATALVLIARPLLFATVDAEVAAARGLPVRAVGLCFLALVGITVAEAVQAVGALLVFGLLVTPAAAAHRLSASPYRALALSAAISVCVLWAGLALAETVDRLPASVAIIGVAFCVYLVALTADGVRRRGRRGHLSGAVPSPV